MKARVGGLTAAAAFIGRDGGATALRGSKIVALVAMRTYTSAR